MHACTHQWEWGWCCFGWVGGCLAGRTSVRGPDQQIDWRGVFHGQDAVNEAKRGIRVLNLAASSCWQTERGWLVTNSGGVDRQQPEGSVGHGPE